MDMNQYPKQYLLISLNKRMMIRKISDPCLVRDQIRMMTIVDNDTDDSLFDEESESNQTKTVTTMTLASFLSNFFY